MSDSRISLSEAREHIDAHFTSTDIEHGIEALEQRIVRRKQRVQLATASGAVLALCLAVLAVRSRSTDAPLADGAVHTHDGSTASTTQPATDLRLERDTESEVALRLERGAGHFEVAKNPRRRYKVRAGEVEVEVLGTVFDVEREAGHARVRVSRGAVQVRWPGGSAVLRAGTEGRFPPVVESAPVPSAAARVESAPTPLPSAETPALEPAKVDKKPAQGAPWRALARAGKHAEAFGSLGHAHVDDLEGLLLAADAARLSGHPREAAAHLERLVQRYPQSAEARLATFTLGRLALYELHAPVMAARAFERAYGLDPQGPLAEDALAREAEAYHRAGDAKSAARVSERYLKQFPAGARKQELERYLGSR